MIKYILIILTLYSCCNSKNNLSENGLITFEKGFIHDSIPEELKYFTYTRVQIDSIVKHSYQLDSVLYIEDSALIKENALNDYKFKVLYYQSINKDTLYSTYFNNDSVLTSESEYILIDTLVIYNVDFSFKIYKYEIPNPPCDGDLTLFFNEKLGLIERYNKGWQGRFTINNDFRFKKDLPLIISEMKSQQDFYYELLPPPLP